MKKPVQKSNQCRLLLLVILSSCIFPLRQRLTITRGFVNCTLLNQNYTAMKQVFVLTIFSFFLFINKPAAQTIDTAAISAAARLLDLQFTAAEKDSMLDGVKDNVKIYQEMHWHNLSNSQPYAFSFNPAPPGVKFPVKQTAVPWNIPANVSLPANRDELAFYSLLQLASLIKNKKISSVELTKFFLERLKKWSDTLQCTVSLTEDIALKEAAAADENLKKGIYKSPLHGIPYGLKDLFAVKGTKTTWGAMPYKDQVVDENAFVYQQLHKAGAVLCAKLSMGALAMGDVWFGGITKNPWNLKQGSSGSSAGSASATAAGLLPFAIGTETLGSIVSPSTRCGVTGLRPTFGSVSRSGAMVLSWSLDKIGPLCRSAEDAAIVFYYIKGSDTKDASSINRSFNYTGRIDFKKLRIAYASNYFHKIPATDPQWGVIETFKQLGAHVQEIIFPDSVMYPVNIIYPILSSECAAAFDAFTRSNLDDQLVRQDKKAWPNTFRVSRLIPAVEYINANRHRTQLIQSMYDFMKNYDILIVPSFAGSQLSITNLTGNPVVCMPAGFNDNGSPVSITLIGKLYDESTILAAAKAFQDKTDFNKKHPPLFSNQHH
jgi:Asp-tRNA(Asn)/Glu-tRNA(Gln) amidotransferase A subunit family amidase